MVRPRTAVAPPATTIYGKPSAIQTISDRRSCGNGWATILIRRPFRSMTSTGDSHPCSAAGPRIRTREPSSSSGRLGYAGLPKAHELGHGGGSSAPGGRAPSTASRASRASLGERRRLMRSGWAEGADSENPSAQPGPSRATAGQLRVVPAQWTDGTRGMGQDDARAVDAQLWSGGEGFSRSLWGGEVGGERQLHRLQPGKVAGVDGAAAGRVATVCGADRRHTVPGSADDRGPGSQY